MSSIWDILDANWLGGKIDIQIQTAHFRVNATEWEYFYDFIQCLKQTFSRPMPEDPSSKTPETPKSTPPSPKTSGSENSKPQYQNQPQSQPK